MVTKLQQAMSIATNNEVMFKILTGHYYAEGKVVHSNGQVSYNYIYIIKWVITLEEKVVVRD